MRIDGSVQISEEKAYYESVAAAAAAGRKARLCRCLFSPLKCHRVDFIQPEKNNNKKEKKHIKNVLDIHLYCLYVIEYIS